MSIAIVAAAAIAEFFTALVITLFVLVAEVLEGMTVSRGRRAIRDLLDFLPRAVSVRRSGTVAEVNADTLNVGDAVLVNPGAAFRSMARSSQAIPSLIKRASLESRYRSRRRRVPPSLPALSIIRGARDSTQEPHVGDVTARVIAQIIDR